jgi:hypothetical protein
MWGTTLTYIKDKILTVKIKLVFWILGGSLLINTVAPSQGFGGAGRERCWLDGAIEIAPSSAIFVKDES